MAILNLVLEGWRISHLSTGICRTGYVMKDLKPEIVINREAKFRIGQVVRHKIYPFRGVIYDVDPTFNNSEEWWLSIPEEVRPSKNQPYYHLLAENAETEYVAYVSEQNLLPDETGEPVRHPQVRELFGALEGDTYVLRTKSAH
jgi:heat shock protein HspQ